VSREVWIEKKNVKLESNFKLKAGPKLDLSYFCHLSYSWHQEKFGWSKHNMLSLDPTPNLKSNPIAIDFFFIRTSLNAKKSFDGTKKKLSSSLVEKSKPNQSQIKAKSKLGFFLLLQSFFRHQEKLGKSSMNQTKAQRGPLMLSSLFFPQLDFLISVFSLGKNVELSCVYFCRTYLAEISPS